jgi:hypothetical protein
MAKDAPCQTSYCYRVEDRPHLPIALSESTPIEGRVHDTTLMTVAATQILKHWMAHLEVRETQI